MSAAERLLRRHTEREEQPQPDVLVWDVPTRLFKWALVALLVTAWVSSSFSDPSMAVHKAAGYGVLTLLVYRTLWGLVGGSTARFRSFVRPPKAVFAYLRSVRSGSQRPYLGHNPAGGAMVLALMLACLIQVGLGLCSSDGVLAAGPLADAIGDTWASRAATLHSAWFYLVILSLSIAHIAVNLFHQFIKRDGLITAMITGRKRRSNYVDAGGSTTGSPVLALLCLSIAAALVYGGVGVAGQFFGAP